MAKVIHSYQVEKAVEQKYSDRIRKLESQVQELLSTVNDLRNAISIPNSEFKILPPKEDTVEYAVPKTTGE